MSDEQSNHTRGFRIVLAEGEVIYGAQFPSGRCVLDDTHRGLLEAAVSFNALAVLTIASATVEWNTVESEVDRLKGDVHAEKADLISARTEVELLRLENKALRLACGLPADLPYDEWPEHSAILPREEKGRP